MLYTTCPLFTPFFPWPPVPPCTSLITIALTFPSSSSCTDPTCAPCSGWWGRRRSTSARVETGTSAPSVAGRRKSHLDNRALAFQERCSQVQRCVSWILFIPYFCGGWCCRTLWHDFNIWSLFVCLDLILELWILCEIKVEIHLLVLLQSPGTSLHFMLYSWK